MSRRRAADAGAQAALPLPPPPLATEPGKPLRIAYFRVSTQDQSLEAQRVELGGSFDREFTDKVTGATLMAERPGFRDLLAQVRPGDTVFVAAVDRLGRDAIDVQTTVNKLLLAGVTVDIKGIGPIGAGVGQLILAVMAQIAQMERQRINARSEAGRAAAREHMARTGKTHKGKERLGGPPQSADPESVVVWRLNKDASIKATARQFDISEATVKRYCALVQGAGQKGKRRGS